jgi:hypothetical protein
MAALKCDLMPKKIKHKFRNGTNFPTLYLPTLLIELFVVVSSLFTILYFMESQNLFAVFMICIGVFFFILLWAGINLAIPKLMGIRSGMLILSKSCEGEIRFRIQTLDFFLFFNPWLRGDGRLIGSGLDGSDSFIILESDYFIPLKLFISKDEYDSLLNKLNLS